MPHDGIRELLDRSPSARESAAYLISQISQIREVELVDTQSTRAAAAESIAHAKAIAILAKESA